MAAQYKLTETEMAKLEILKLKDQLCTAHKEILTLTQSQIVKERGDLNNRIVKQRNIDGELFDVLVDDVKGVVITQPKAASPEK